MDRAFELAEQGRMTARPNPLVGCVLARHGEIVAEGFHRRAGEAHAEVDALANLAQAGLPADGLTVYVTLEPCSHHGRTPPCCDTLIKAGIGRVVYAAEDPNPRVRGTGLARLRDAGIVVDYLDCGDKPERLNPGFIKRMCQGLPLVRVKLAMSIDGHTALASGESRWITGPEARQDVHYWRGRSDAVVTGIGTLLADDPLLTTRVDQPVAQQLRVVVDSAGRMPAGSKLLQQPGSVLHCVAEGSSGPEHPQLERLQLPLSGLGLDLNVLVTQLAARQCNEVWVEAGSRLATAFILAGLVDELIIYVAPLLLGEGGLPLLRLPQLAVMEQRTQLQLIDLRRLADDVRLTYRLADRTGHPV